jgi:UDP-3-O-[3-hydroxymyristoyl] glucosamine N-acyltransferase
MKRFYLSDFRKHLDCYALKIHGKVESASFTNAKTAKFADENSIIFVVSSKLNVSEVFASTKAGIIICEKLPDDFSVPGNCVIIETMFPKLLFSHLINETLVEKIPAGISRGNSIDERAVIGANVYIGPNSVIGNCKIGDNAIIFGNVFIYDNVTIGSNCVIHAGAILGASGQGYVKDKDGTWISFPQIGNTVIEDNVEIGALTYVTRGALGDTIIRKGSKIGLACCIGHGVEIGENSMVIANSVIAGSAIIGRNAWIAHSSTIRNSIRVGEDVMIGMGSVVTKNIESSKTVIGNPAEEIEDFRMWSKIKKKLIGIYGDKAGD